MLNYLLVEFFKFDVIIAEELRRFLPTRFQYAFIISAWTFIFSALFLFFIVLYLSLSSPPADEERQRKRR